jgi:hypothetical protein
MKRAMKRQLSLQDAKTLRGTESQGGVKLNQAQTAFFDAIPVQD